MRARVDPLLPLMGLSLFLNGFWLWWGLPNGVERWATDSIQVLHPLAAVKATFVEDWWNSGYYTKFPMGHFFVLLAAYAPYLLWLFATGQLRPPSGVYPYGLDDPETSLMVLMLIANGVSALMGVGIVVLVYLTARHLFGRLGALFAALTVAFSPPFVFYAHTSNVDTPSLFWSALGLYAFARLLTGPRPGHIYGLLGFAVGMAAATKEQTYGLFVLVPLSVLLLHARHHGYGRGPAALGRSLIHPKILGGLAACCLTFVVATHLVFNWDGSVKRFKWRLYGIHPNFGMDYTPPPVEVQGVADALGQTLALLWDSMNPFLFLVGMVGLAWLVWRRAWGRHLSVMLLGYFVFVIMQIPFIRARFVMELVLVIALFAGWCLAMMWRTAPGTVWAKSSILAGLWLYAFAYGFEVDYRMMRDARYDAEGWFHTQGHPEATIEVYAQRTYLPRIHRRFQVVQQPFTGEVLADLRQRRPDFVVLTSAHYRELPRNSPEEALWKRLVRGDFGYRPVRSFRREPIVGPDLIPSLSPEITVLRNHADPLEASGPPTSAEFGR